MSFDTSPTQRAFAALLQRGFDAASASDALAALQAAGVDLHDARPNTLVVHWVDAQERAVPPDADTIIRTITRTVGAHSTSTTHWLDGLRGPVT